MVCCIINLGAKPVDQTTIPQEILEPSLSVTAFSSTSANVTCMYAYVRVFAAVFVFVVCFFVFFL